MSLPSAQPGPSVADVVAERTARAVSPVSPVVAFWRTTIGKKTVMAVSGLLFVLFLIAHMVGNLKIFAGAAEFDAYGAWLRTIGEPVLSHGWYLWIQRVGLLVALVAHVTAAAQLSARDLRARPVKYAHGQRVRATYATRTMRWGGVILALFVVWHVLDLTVGVVNPDFRHGQPHHNVVVDFQVWWINLIYIVAMVMLGLHINHGFASAAQTLGVTRPARRRAIRAVGTTLAVVLTAGYLVVPLGVMTGMVS